MTEENKAGNGGPAPEAGVESAVPSAGDLFARTVKSVCDGVARATKGAGVLEAITEVVQGSVKGAVGAGNSLVLGAKAIVVGVLRGTEEKEEAALKTLSHTSRAVIRSAAQLGGDLSATAKGLVLGAIACARDANLDREKSTASAAQGALEGAEEAGSDAAEKVRKALKEDIGGVKVVLPAPVSKR